MIKKIFAALFAVVLMTGICAAAEQVNIEVEETSAGLFVSVTSPIDGGMYIIGAKYNAGGQVENVAIQHIDNAVSGEIYTAELDGIYSGSSIYIWDDNQKPLCDKIGYNGAGTANTPNPEETPTATSDVDATFTPDPDATPTPIPDGDGIIHLKGTEIDASGVTGAEVNGSIVTITAVGDYINIRITAADYYDLIGETL